MPKSFDSKLFTPRQPDGDEFEVGEPEGEQALDTCSGSSAFGPLESLRAQTTKMPSIKLRNRDLGTFPNRELATPRARTSSGKVSELVQAYEVKSNSSDQSVSPLKIRQPQQDASLARITPCQPSRRLSLPVKKLADGRFLAQFGTSDDTDVVDNDTFMSTTCEQDGGECPLYAEFTASTAEFGGNQECATPLGSPAYTPRESNASEGVIASPLTQESQSNCPRFGEGSIVKPGFDYALRSASDVLALTQMSPHNQLPEVSIESENRETISVNYKKNGVVRESLVTYSIRSCSRSTSPCSVPQRHPFRCHPDYPDQYFLSVHPRKLTTHFQDGQVCLAIMFPDPGGIVRKTADACKAVGSSTKSAFGEASRAAQTPIGKGVLAGAAVLSVAGGGSGAIAGSGVGALAGIFMAPFTFGLSIPVGAWIGCGAGACMGVTAGGAVGAASGGALAYAFQGKHEETASIKALT